MSKVYKIKEKLVVYIPFDVSSSLSIKEGDEVDFFKRDGYFLFAKKSDIANMLAGGDMAQKMQPGPEARPVRGAGMMAAPTDREMDVLRKLDTIRYSSRTREKVDAVLSQDERKVLQELLKKKFVTLFKKQGENEFKYGISKGIYDNFLFGKRGGAKTQPQQPPGSGEETQPQQKKWEQRLDEGNSYLKLLESRGYLVLASQVEAAAASASLEESIRHGMVVGIRAFNKKFYVATRNFIGRSLPKISRMLGQKGVSVSDISKETGIDEDGVRTVLYIMAEGGDVSEIRRDVFRAA